MMGITGASETLSLRSCVSEDFVSMHELSMCPCYFQQYAFGMLKTSALWQVWREAGEGQPLPSQLLQMQPAKLPGEEDCGAQPRERRSIQVRQQGGNQIV